MTSPIVNLESNAVGFHPTEGRPIFAIEYYDKPELTCLDSAYQADFVHLKELLRVKEGLISEVEFSNGELKGMVM